MSKKQSDTMYYKEQVKRLQLDNMKMGEYITWLEIERDAMQKLLGEYMSMDGFRQVKLEDYDE